MKCPSNVNFDGTNRRASVNALPSAGMMMTIDINWIAFLHFFKSNNNCNDKFWSNIIIQDGWQEAKRMLSTWRSKAWCNTFQELCIQIQILYCVNSHPPRREVYFDSSNFVVLYCGLMQVKFTHILQGCFTDIGAIIPFFFSKATLNNIGKLILCHLFRGPFHFMIFTS